MIFHGFLLNLHTKILKYYFFLYKFQMKTNFEIYNIKSL